DEHSGAPDDPGGARREAARAAGLEQLAHFGLVERGRAAVEPLVEIELEFVFRELDSLEPGAREEIGQLARGPVTRVRLGARFRRVARSGCAPARSSPPRDRPPSPDVLRPEAPRRRCRDRSPPRERASRASAQRTAGDSRSRPDRSATALWKIAPPARRTPA